MADKFPDVEKPEVDERELDPAEQLGLSLARDSRITAFTVEEQKAITWRIDCRLVLTLGLLYMISLMDRTNLGAASVAGYVRHSGWTRLKLMGVLACR